MHDSIHSTEASVSHAPKEARVKLYGIPMVLYRFHRFDGDGGGDDGGNDDGGQESGNEGGRKRTVEQRVEDELEKRYRPRSVREFLAQYNDDKDLALEKAIELANDRFQKHIKADVRLQAEKEDLQGQIKTLREERDSAQKERDEYKGSLEERDAKARETQIQKSLEKSFPDTHKALRLALKNEGYELEMSDKDEIMVKKGDKRHQLKTVLTDDFYKEYDFAKPKDESPFGGTGGEGGDVDFASEAAAAFKDQDKSAFASFGDKE